MAALSASALFWELQEDSPTWHRVLCLCPPESDQEVGLSGKGMNEQGSKGTDK